MSHITLTKIRSKALLLLLFSLAIFLFSLLAYLNLDKNSSEATDINNNWQAGAIIDIAIGSSKPEGYSNAFRHFWPGNGQNCWCGDASSISKSYYYVDGDKFSGVCTLNRTRAGCVNVVSQPGILLNKIGRIEGVDDKNVTIYVKRSTENWMNTAQKSDETCQDADAIKCGTSKENIFCTKEKKCPINDIQIVQTSLSSDLLNCNYEEGCLVLSKDSLGNNGVLLKFMRGDKFDALPTAEFRLNEYGMCDYKDKNNITPGREDHWTLREKRTTCNKEGDALWNSSGFSVTEKNLFDMNGVTPSIDYLSKFEEYYEAGKSGSSYNYNVYSRSYIPWAHSCRDKMAELAPKSESFADITSSHETQLIIAGISILANFFAASFRFPSIIARFIQLGFQIYVLVKVVPAAAYFSSLSSNDCSTPNIISFLQSLSSQAKWSCIYDGISLVVLVVSLVFDIHRMRNWDSLYIKNRRHRSQSQKKHKGGEIDLQSFAPSSQTEAFSQSYSINSSFQKKIDK